MHDHIPWWTKSDPYSGLENNDGWWLMIYYSLESLEKGEIKSIPLTSNPQHKPHLSKPFLTEYTT
jgi:hypothetical protein